MRRRNSVVTLTPLPKEAFSPNHILDSDLVSFYRYDEFSLHGYAWSCISLQPETFFPRSASAACRSFMIGLIDRWRLLACIFLCSASAAFSCFMIGSIGCWRLLACHFPRVASGAWICSYYDWLNLLPPLCLVLVESAYLYHEKQKYIKKKKPHFIFWSFAFSC